MPEANRRDGETADAPADGPSGNSEPPVLEVGQALISDRYASEREIQFRRCPLPTATHLLVQSSLGPTGPRAWRRSVLMPTTAPMP